MQVKFTSTLDDYVAFTRHVNLKSPILWVLFIVPSLLIPLLAIPVVGEEVQRGKWPAAIVAAVFGAAAGLGVFGIIFCLRNKLIDWSTRALVMGRDTRGVCGRNTLILSEELLVLISEVARYEVPWQNFTSVEETSDHTFICLGFLIAIIVPRHAFSSPEDYEAVRNFAMSRIGPTIR